MQLDTLGVAYEQGTHTVERILSADLVIKSPGIPDTVPLVQQLRAQGTLVVDEVEFAARHAEGTVIAITGSNGKTTTTLLTAHLLQSAGRDAAAVGNVGHSFAAAVADGGHAFYALEVSSFQLDGTVDFRPDYAILLNITADHLDRYEYDIRKYAASKMRIARNQRAGDTWVYNEADELIADLRKDQVHEQTLVPILPRYLTDEGIAIEDRTYDLKDTVLRGPHNAFNAACAIAVMHRIGLTSAEIQHGLNTFTNAPHRLEKVAIINDVTYINDSKATNVDAVYYALQAVSAPIVLIVGGVDKGNDYTQIAALVRDKVRVLIGMGTDNAPVRRGLSAYVDDYREASTLAAAMAHVDAVVQRGDSVLLSPACASFDLFSNYIDRGDQFKAAVLRRQ